MKEFNSIEELKPYYVEEMNTYVFEEEVKFNFNLIVSSNIVAEGINALDIKAFDIKAWNIKALDIKALDIRALNIEANNIEYYAFCIAYRSLVCESIEGRRHNSIHRCLDNDIVIRKPKQKVTLELTEEQFDKLKQLLGIT